MRICVCIKEVPPTSVPKRLEPETGLLVRSGRGHLNTPDTHALEEALRIRDAQGEGEVVTITMAPGHATESVRHALAMGADRSILVTDEALRGSDLLATSRALAAALEREQPDLTLLGWEGTDANGAMLWAAIGERLGVSVVSRVWELAVADGAVRATRQMEYGFDVVEAELPCVVALAGVTNAPRYPSLKSIVASKRKPVATVDAGALGLEPGQVGVSGSATTVLDAGPPPPRTMADVITDEERAAELLVDYLADRGVI